YSEPGGEALWPRIEGSPAIAKSLLQIAAGSDPRIAELARRVAGKSPTDAARVAAVREHLKTKYAYSTLSRDGRANLADFLFKTRAGNCEYFATAAAILLRHVGVPTRLVTGFLSWEWNEYGRFYDVRQSQAHAWTEALVDGRWVTVDATPGDDGLLRTFSDRLTQYLDA